MSLLMRICAAAKGIPFVVHGIEYANAARHVKDFRPLYLRYLPFPAYVIDQDYLKPESGDKLAFPADVVIPEYRVVRVDTAHLYVKGQLWFLGKIDTRQSQGTANE